MLKSSHKIASILLLGNDNALDLVLKELGQNSRASRVYIFQIDGAVMNNTHEYVNPDELKTDDNPEGIEPEINNLQGLPTETFWDWISILQSGKTINAPNIHEYGFSKATHDILTGQRIKSILVMPLFWDDELFGFIGFDECKYFRKWDSAMIEYLQTNAQNIALFLKNQKSAQDLMESRKSYKDLVDLLPQALFEIDLEGNFTFANEFGLKHFGYTQQDIDRGFNVLNLFSETERKRVKENIKRILQGENLSGNEYVARKKDGNEVQVLIYSSPIVYEDKPIGLRGIVLDITDKKRAEQAIIDAERLTAVGEIAAGVAHDFNNALQSILGNLELAMSDRQIPEQVRNDLNRVKKAATAAASSVRQLQRFAGHARKEPKMKVVDVKSIVNDGLAQTRHLWKDEAHRQGIVYNINNECADSLTILGDHGDLRNVLYNLLKNSLQAMPDGGNIDIKAHLDDNENVRIRVSDTGAGMDLETQKRIFQPFFSTKGFEQGKGLGMSRVYATVKEHKGKISVTSVVNEGTVVEISFPYKKPHIPVQDVFEYEGMADVLWVDDEDPIRDIGKRILSSLGHSAETASNGHEALELLKKRQAENKLYDLVITDIGMPGMSGWQLAKRIKENYPAVKIAVVTGWGNDITPEKRAEFGVGYVIGKPVGIDQVKRLVGEVLQMK